MAMHCHKSSCAHFFLNYYLLQLIRFWCVYAYGFSFVCVFIHRIKHRQTICYEISCRIDCYLTKMNCIQRVYVVLLAFHPFCVAAIIHKE